MLRRKHTLSSDLWLSVHRSYIGPKVLLKQETIWEEENLASIWFFRVVSTCRSNAAQSYNIALPVIHCRRGAYKWPRPGSGTWVGGRVKGTALAPFVVGASYAICDCDKFASNFSGQLRVFARHQTACSLLSVDRRGVLSNALNSRSIRGRKWTSAAKTEDRGGDSLGIRRLMPGRKYKSN